MDAAIIGGGLAAGLVVVGFLRNALTTSPTTEPDHGNVHGSASIAGSLAEVEAAGLTSKQAGGFFIAAVQAVKEKTTRWFRFQQDTGALVFGGPGTGKGVGFVIPTLLDRDKTTRESLLVFDPAAQNIFVTSPYLQSINYRVVYSNLVAEHAEALKQFGAPLRMNPLAAVNLDNNSLAELEIAETAAALVPVMDARSSFFSGTAQQLTAAIALWLRETEGSQATWPNVAELIHQSPFTLNELFGRMRHSRFASVRATAALWFSEIDPETKKLRNPPTEGARDVLATARRELNFLLTAGITEMFSGTGAEAFNFATLKNQKTAYFLILPDDPSDALRKCAYVMLRTAKLAMMKPRGLPVLWLLDEMCAALPAAGAALIRDSAALVRKYGIRIAGISQSWAQFEHWCGDTVQANALRSMFGAAIYYGANDNTSIGHIMKECGHYTVWQPASKPVMESGEETNSAPMAVPLFQPEDIRAMIPQQKQIISLIGSRQMVVLPRANYRQIAQLKARAAADRYHPEHKTQKEAS